jgi:membrane fusion protein (multidrug efflux system)
LLQLDVREDKARQRALQARQQLASKSYARNQKLFQQQRISEQTLDESKAELDSVEAELAQVSVQIDKKTITAPFAARAGIHHLEPGQLLTAQSTVTTLIGLKPYLWIDFELPQAAPLLNTGDKVTILAKPKNLLAEIIAREGELSNNSRNLRYRAKFPIDGHDLLPHSVVQIQVPSGDALEASLIPDTALRVDQLGSFVYLIETDQESGDLRAHRQPVEVANRRNNEAAILSGLKPGDRIAAQGAFKLRDDTKVTIKQTTTELEGPQS